MRKDEIVEEIHRIREEYAKSFNYDLDAIFADLQKQQAEGGWKVVDLSRKPALDKQDNQSINNELLMNEQEKLARKESNRYQILKLFYETLGNDKCLGISEQQVINYLIENKAMSEQETESALDYLRDESLLELQTFNSTSITHQGIKEIEASIKYPNQKTEHFSKQAIQVIIMGDHITNKNDLRGANVGNLANINQNNAQQVASDFSQNINQNIDEITKLIDSLRNMAQEFSEDQREEALVHLDDLQEDIATPEKQKPQRIKAHLVVLLTIGAGVVAGGTDFANNVFEIANKFGINLPQLIQNSPM